MESSANTLKDIDDFLSEIPQNTGIVTESYSVSEAIFLRLRDAGYNPVSSDPYKTRTITLQDFKTNEIYAKVLAELLRGGYISARHIPSQDILEMRHLVRYRQVFGSQTMMHHTHAIPLIRDISTRQQLYIPASSDIAPTTPDIVIPDMMMIKVRPAVKVLI